MLQRWLGESLDEGPYIALGTADSVGVSPIINLEEEAEILALDLEH